MKFSKKNPLPPKSIIRLEKLWPWASKHGYNKGQEWRVGYYSEKDGFDKIWMVNEAGEYEQMANHLWISKYFKIVEISDETDLYGEKRKKLGRLKS